MVLSHERLQINLASGVRLEDMRSFHERLPILEGGADQETLVLSGESILRLCLNFLRAIYLFV